MKYSFDKATCRENSNAEKYTLRKELFKTDDVLPVWVADMDIDTPEFILDSVKERLNHPVMGYEEVPKSAFEAQCDWMKNRYGVEFKVEDMLYSHSVVASMNVAIEAFSGVGDGVVVQTPIYPPFFHSVSEHEREVVKNPLKLLACGKWEFDIDDLKSKIDKNTKLLLLCNPHNPVGRAWRREELEQILEICLKHNIVVFSDEIHCDLVYKPYTHIPFASLGKEAKNICITAIGVGKTFNMAGFAMSSVAITNKELMKTYKKVYDKVHFAQGSTLSHVAFERAYRDGEEWLDELKTHLYGNFCLLDSLCKRFPHAIKLTPIEATYLAWLDCRGMKMSNHKLRKFFIDEAKLGLNAGLAFGREGSGFMRLNFAVSRDKMLLIIEQLENALKDLPC